MVRIEEIIKNKKQFDIMNLTANVFELKNGNLNLTDFM